MVVAGIVCVLEAAQQPLMHGAVMVHYVVNRVDLLLELLRLRAMLLHRSRRLGPSKKHGPPGKGAWQTHASRPRAASTSSSRDSLGRRQGAGGEREGRGGAGRQRERWRERRPTRLLTPAGPRCAARRALHSFLKLGLTFHPNGSSLSLLQEEEHETGAQLAGAKGQAAAATVGALEPNGAAAAPHCSTLQVA